MVECMNGLKEAIIEKLDGLPDTTLRQVADYLTQLTQRRFEEDPRLFSVAGGLSGPPISAEEIEQELYGPQAAR